ncbi:MAG TPA: MFS transporter [Anaerolineales bacterium]|nr:MFS transporter [Anaerolineales bacterium]
MSFAFSVIFTVNMVFQVEVAGLTPLQLVLVGTALELSAFIFEIPTGIVADVYSRRLSVIIGIAITGVAYLLQSIPVFPAIAFASALWGLGYTFTSGAHAAWITDEVGVEHVGRVFLRAGQAGRIGGLLGIPVSVLLARAGLHVPILAGGLIILALAVFLVLFMGETGFKAAPKEERDTWADMAATLREGLAVVRGRPALRGFLLIALFVGLYSEGYDRLWTAHLLEHFEFPFFNGLEVVGWFGLFRMADSLIGIGLNEWVRRRLDLNDMRKSVRLLQLLYGLMIAGLVVFAWTASFPAAVAAMLVFDMCRGLTYPIQGAWTNQFVDSKVRATVLSFESQVDAFGQTAGGPVLGFTGNRFGLRPALTLAAAILIPVLPLYRRTLRK